MKDLQKTFSKHFDVDYKPIDELVPVPIEKEEIEKTENQTEDDFQNVRKTLNSLIEKGSVAIEDMHSIALDDGSARSFEVLATLIKTVGETTEKLLSAHEKKVKLRVEKGEKLDNRNGVSIDKAVFVGTPAELMRKIKAEEKKNDK